MFHCTQEKHHPFNARKKRTADTYVRTVLLIKSHNGELIHMVLISHAPPGRYKILNNRIHPQPRGWDDPVPGYDIPPGGDAHGHFLPPDGASP